MAERVRAMDTGEIIPEDTSDIITLDMLIEDLKVLAADWEELAMYLNFKDHETDRIKKDVADIKSRTRHGFNGVMSEWFSQYPDKVTAAVLAKAVEECDYRVLAEEIRERDRAGKLTMTKPEISALLESVQHKYPTLAIHLGLPPSTVDHLEKFAGDCSRCLEKMLEKYVREKAPDVDSVVKAVANVRHKNLSLSLQTKYQNKNSEGVYFEVDEINIGKL